VTTTCLARRLTPSPPSPHTRACRPPYNASDRAGTDFYPQSPLVIDIPDGALNVSWQFTDCSYMASPIDCTATRNGTTPRDAWDTCCTTKVAAQGGPFYPVECARLDSLNEWQVRK
jgi:hypothetical protein